MCGNKDGQTDKRKICIFVNLLTANGGEKKKKKERYVCMY